MTIYSLDILLSQLEPVHCSMSLSNCCFLNCIQISQEAGQVIWYSHLFKNFPQFVVIHTVKGFGVINKAGLDAFLVSRFFNDPVDVGNLISGSSAFSKTSLNVWKFMYCWSLAWRILSLLYQHVRWVQLCGHLSILWHCLSLGLEWNWPFLVLWPLLSFPDLLTYWVQHFIIIYHN